MNGSSRSSDRPRTSSRIGSVACGPRASRSHNQRTNVDSVNEKNPPGWPKYELTTYKTLTSWLLVVAWVVNLCMCRYLGGSDFWVPDFQTRGTFLVIQWHRLPPGRQGQLVTTSTELVSQGVIYATGLYCLQVPRSRTIFLRCMVPYS